MDHQQEPDESKGALPLPPAPGIQNPARRRFNRAGLGASGVIVTLACKPILGHAAVTTPSGFMSGNNSRHGGALGSMGRLPAYWLGATTWPIPKDTKFSAVFSVGRGSPFADATLEDMLKGHPADTSKIGVYLTAALLNARSGYTPFLREENLMNMFVEWSRRGFYMPVAGVKWTSLEVVNYLKSTQS